MSNEVLVALIGACALLGVALIENSRRTRREAEAARAESSATAAAIGQPNGKGNVVQMLEQILQGQTGQDGRLARLEGWHADKVERLGDITVRLAALDRGAAYSHRTLEHLHDQSVENAEAMSQLDARLSALEERLSDVELEALRRVRLLRHLGVDIGALELPDEEGG